MLRSWPEVDVVIKERRHELVLKGIDDNRKPSIDDDALQNDVFSDNSVLNFVSITSCGLTNLSSTISRCQQLTRLTLACNNLKSLPDALGDLSKLTFVDVSGNLIATLPRTFANLKNLETFVASANQLTDGGIFDLCKLDMLHVLDLSHNKLTKLPESLFTGRMSKLHTINFGNNDICEVNEGLSNLTSLKDVNLSSNQLTLTPEPFKSLEKVRFLDLSNNPFKDGRFKKLVNDKRAKVSAILSYISKTASKNPSSTGVKLKTSPTEVDQEPTSIPLIVGDLALTVKRLPSVKDIRPHLVCCVLRNLDLKGDNFKKFINIQTKLHTSLCQNRTVAAIGTHEMNSFEPPLQYLALPAEDLHITALHKKVPVSAKELVDALVRDADLARRRTKRNTLNPLHRYLNLVKQLPLLPCLIDSNGLVISLPPITNSDLTKMSEETTSVWVEVSSTESIQVCKEVLDTLLAETVVFCSKLSVEQVRVFSDDDLLSVYPDKNDLSTLQFKQSNVE